VSRLLLLIAVAAGLLPSRASAQEPPPAADRGPEPVRGLDAYVHRAMEGWRAPGLSLVIVRGDSVSTRAYGVTEVGGSAPVTPRTLFGIGSLTKAFTATVIAMLVDEDRIAWDDPVVRLLPGFAMHDPYVTRHLTIRDVLSHRTGLARDDLMWIAGARSGEELVRRLRFQEPSHGFRARFGYHNVMYLLAGELARGVTGEPWAAHVRRRIFEPLGMRRSAATIGELRERTGVALPHDAVGPGQVLGTVPRPDVPLDASTAIRRIDWFDPATAPAGAIASSAEEFASWLRFHLSGGVIDGERLIGAGALLETRIPQTPLPGFSRNQTEPAVTTLGAYGMGWGVRDYRGNLMVSHLGSTQGWSSAAALLPARDLGVAVFVNITRGTGLTDGIQRWVLDRLLGAEPKDWAAEALARARERRAAATAALAEAAESREGDDEPTLSLDAYAGIYVDSLYPPARVAPRNGRLRLVLGPDLEGVLDHWEGDTFRVTWDRPELGANLVTFEVGTGSHPERLETRVLGRRGVWRRSEEPAGDRGQGGLPSSQRPPILLDPDR